MKHFKHWLYVMLLPLSLLAALSACKKEPGMDTPPQAPALRIVSIEPATAPVGSTVVVNGENFSTTPGSNTVTIGGVPATVISASPTQLVVVVPEGAANGPIGITAGGQTVQSSGTFTVAQKSAKPISEVRGTRFMNLTWSKDTIYLLRGMVYIPADYTLTIQPGTVIKGAGPELDPEGKNQAGTLVVERRGKIMAMGTPTAPIVFTSAKPAGQRGYGDWGGVVLVGKAAFNQPGTTLFAGGVRGTVETYSEFDDNSGTLQYVRIEFAGTAPSTPAENKLSGLTLYGVGYRTTINHVQVSHSSGDAFGWFGGTVTAKNLVAFRTYDDDWSTNWGYIGRVQFGVALRDPQTSDPSGSNGFESENFNPGENADGSPLSPRNGLPQTAPIFANMSSFGVNTTITSPAREAAGYQSGIHIRRNSAISIYNSLIYGYTEGLRLDGTATGTYANATSNALDLKGIVLANVLTPVVGGGAITTDQANAYFTAAGRGNQIIASSDIGSLLLNATNFNLTAPNFLPQGGSPLLTGAVTGGKLDATVGQANSEKFFIAVPYRGAFGTENWLASWTNFDPQNTNYDQ
ncbi:IPT/TIG domain-containing protein [Spirosoma soli]|uniref:IPT/TIG domain-containing protein n=1 Tax=Spirosoma soli TaxID=1770529 RepID=A0ABW5M0I7_9BACT